MKEPNSFRYIIGIDLGTTQCAMFYIDLEERDAGIRHFSIPQLVASGQVEAKPTLASALYFPESDLNLNPPAWIDRERPVVGHFARELGFSLPSRLVHSAKSWLCHPRLHGKSAFLPWQSDTVTNKLSPVQASQYILEHLARAWDIDIGGKKGNHLFARQKIVVTVPASFDPVAKNFTLEAISNAGISDFSLLEEPQAAFYDYLYRNPKNFSKDLTDIKTVLVVDIGGGTTDFSLIGVERHGGSELPTFNRIAVGSHLLIGGDNLDLALARYVENLLKHKGKKLIAKQWLALLNQCRDAKENALADFSEGKVKFVLPGAGSRVISQTLTEEIEKKKIREILVEGYFPSITTEERPEEEAALGISEAGLPYTRDPAITKHLAAFIGENGAFPDAVLFNGGTLISRSLRERLLENLSHWNEGRTPLVIENPNPTLAVACGAVYFGMTGLGLGSAIKSGNPLSIYLGVGTDDSSTPDRHIPERLMCLLPKDSECEREYEVEGKTFGIDTGQTAAFYLYYTHLPPKGDSLGAFFKYNSKRYFPLPPLKLEAKGKPKSEIKQVRLRVVLKETGYLQIFCHGYNEDYFRELSFDVSQKDGIETDNQPEVKKPILNKRQITRLRKWLDGLANENLDKSKFGMVFKDLEELTELPREKWELPLLRALFDLLIDEKRFDDTEESLIAWLRLTGYCLRPGFGEKFDDNRVELLRLRLERGFSYSQSAFWSEVWLLWKRIAPGLSEKEQNILQTKIEHLLFPPKRPEKNARHIDQHEKNHIWRLMGHLERLPRQEKERLGWWILKAPATFGKDFVALYALGRLGSRNLSYASPTNLVSQAVANEWTEALLRRLSSGSSYLFWALRELGRKTGDRLVQIDDTLRRRIIDVMKKENRKKSFMTPLIEIVTLQNDDFAEYCGESLPSGFVWVKEETPSSSTSSANASPSTA